MSEQSTTTIYDFNNHILVEVSDEGGGFVRRRGLCDAIMSSNIRRTHSLFYYQCQ